MKVRKGFTLVELLIVIVIIGILAAAMLLSSGAATASAEASNIVSDLRNGKAGAMMLYADSLDLFEATPTTAVNITMLQNYVDNPLKYVTGGPYLFELSAQKWWIGYDLALGQKNQNVRDKLAGRARVTGLLGAMDLNTQYLSTHTVVYMVVR